MGQNEDKPTRIYHFELPYTITGMYVHFGRNKLISEGLFQQLPHYIQVRFNDAADSWSELVITERDCNAIDDDPWTHIASELGLNWT